MFVSSVLIVIAGLGVLAVRANRADRHPALSTALWLLAVTLLAWTGLIWLVGAYEPPGHDSAEAVQGGSSAALSDSGQPEDESSGRR